HRHPAGSEGEPRLRRRRDHGRRKRRERHPADVARPRLRSDRHVPHLRGPVPARGRGDPLEAQAAHLRRDRREEPHLLARGGHGVHVDSARANQTGRRGGPRLLDPRSVPLPPEAARHDDRGPEDGPAKTGVKEAVADGIVQAVNHYGAVDLSRYTAMLAEGLRYLLPEYREPADPREATPEPVSPAKEEAPREPDEAESKVLEIIA